MNEYKRFLAIWDCIHIMNTAKIFTYGIAKHRDGGPVIEFENTDQIERYNTIFR